MKVYLSGPMTGYVDWNRPAFHAAAAHLRSLGYEVVNPAEMDAGIPDEELAKVAHSWFLRRDVKALVDCDAIYLLPGWRWSKGAALEATVADGCGILRLHEHDDTVWRTFEGEPLPETPEPPTVLTIPADVMPCTVQPILSRDYLHNYGNVIDESVDRHHRKGA